MTPTRACSSGCMLSTVAADRRGSNGGRAGSNSGSLGATLVTGDEHSSMGTVGVGESSMGTGTLSGATGLRSGEAGVTGLIRGGLSGATEVRWCEAGVTGLIVGEALLPRSGGAKDSTLGATPDSTPVLPPVPPGAGMSNSHPATAVLMTLHASSSRPAGGSRHMAVQLVVCWIWPCVVNSMCKKRLPVFSVYTLRK